MLGLQFEDAMKEEVNTDQINITLSSDIEWLHLVQSRVFSQSYEFPKLYDWSTTQIGTFFAKALPIFYKITKKDPFEITQNVYTSWSRNEFDSDRYCLLEFIDGFSNNG